MGVFGSQGTERPSGNRRSIWRTFAVMVGVPVAGLVVLWGLVLGGVIGGAVGGPDTPEHDHMVVVEFVVVIGIGLVIVITGVTMMGLFARRLARDISGLEATAQHLADEEMPALIEQLRQGGPEAIPAGAAAPQLRTKTAEIAEAEAAITSLQRTAAAAAVGEARLRNGIGQVFVSLARRNQSLLQRQLRLIDALEQKASDPATLADLFPLDHLTTRMRRHAEGLIILSGAAPGRSWSEPVPVIDVIRGAVAEVEDYKRVTVLTRSEDAVAGLAAADMIHLLAELIENATLSSPSGTRVEVRAERVANGFAIEIDDRGLGIEAGQLRTINQQLAQPPDFDLANADQLGLFVVGKLAARHGVRVALRPSPYGGTTAVVLMPNSIVVPVSETEEDTDPGLRLEPGRTPGLDLPQADALALTGQPPAPASLTGRPPALPSLPGRALAPPSLAEEADPTETAGNGPGPARDPAAGGLAGFRLGSLPPRLGSSPPRPATPSPLTPRPATPGLAPPGPATPRPDRPAPAADGPDPFGLAAAGAAPAPPPAPAPAADASASPGLAPGSQSAGTYRGLPRRIRQASLNPHLRDSPSAAARGANADSTPPSPTRSPEEARSLVASLQSGWQRGRESDVPDGEPADPAQAARRPDSEAPRGEEALWTNKDWPGPASS
jgi:signal transduction histidine kinase